MLLQHDLSIKPSVLCRCIKARAFFSLVIVMMAVNLASVHEREVCQELQQRGLLPVVSRVLGSKIIIKAANVSNPDTMSVMAPAMNAWSADRAALFNRPI